jgi:hypothetical protein
MGPKLLAAFGAGALVTAIATILVMRQPEPAQPVSPLVIPAAVPAPAPEPAFAPPAPAPEPKLLIKKKRAKKFKNAAVIERPQAPSATAISLPEVEANNTPEVATTPIAVENAPLPPRQRETVTLASGTLLQVRLSERLSSDRNVVGDAFAATLDQPLVVNGYVIAERGARVLGRVVDVAQAGRVKGVSEMAVELSSLTTADGQKINLRTASFIRRGDTSHRDDAVKVGVGSAIGAAIGAIAGGGKGAAIGAASGGALGTGAVLATRGKAAILDSETRLSFRLERPITITER